MKARLILLTLGLGAAFGAAEPAAALRFTLAPTMLDLGACLARPGEVRVPLVATNLNLEIVGWTTSATTNDQPGEFELRLLFPIPLGSLIAYAPGTVHYAVNHQWLALPAGKETSGHLQVRAFPAEVSIEAVKFTIPARPVPGAKEKSKQYQATLPFAVLVPVRAVNVAPAATVTFVSTNATDAGPASAFNPETLVDGIVDAPTSLAAQTNLKRKVRPPPNEVRLTWNRQQTFRGVTLFQAKDATRLEGLVLEKYIGAGEPGSATEAKDWRQLTWRATAPGQFAQNQFFVFGENAETRALRLRTTSAAGLAGLTEIVVLSLLSHDQPAASPTSPPAAPGVPRGPN